MNLDPFNKPVLGLDEVGRGPLAGPVVATGVYFLAPNKKLKKFYNDLGITDSKKITHKKRQYILGKLGIDIKALKKNKIYELEHFSFCISEVSELEIDKINILQASLKAMEKSLVKLVEKNNINSCKILIDGNKALKPNSKSALLFNNRKLNFECVIAGDSKYLAIALASIIAKEYRDLLMKRLSKKFPDYQFEKHNGYPTKEHKNRIEKFGVLDVHRKTFKGVKEHIKRP